MVDFSKVKLKMAAKHYIKLYLVACVVGFALEWGYGALWSVLGTTPWVYPDSLFVYTSLKGIPVWGFGGPAMALIHEALKTRSLEPLRGVAWILMATAVVVVLLSLTG